MIRHFTQKTFEAFKLEMIGLAGKLFIDLLFSTIRVETEGFQAVRKLIESRRVIVVFWHSRILLISYLFKGENGVALVSRSEDGEIIARIIERQGHEPVRGSTSKGGLRAMAVLIKKLKEQNRPAVIIPDGPQGPRFKVQPGVITLAKKTGYPVLPISYSAERMKVFASWDRFILPYPFTRCRVIFGNPLTVPEDSDREAEAASRIRLEEEMCRITNRADRLFGHVIS